MIALSLSVYAACMPDIELCWTANVQVLDHASDMVIQMFATCLSRQADSCVLKAQDHAVYPAGSQRLVRTRAF